MMPAESGANVIDGYGEGSMAATSGEESDDRPPGTSLLHTVYLNVNRLNMWWSSGADGHHRK
jgi:hypothetical protein